jgi:hypothetical protein
MASNETVASCLQASTGLPSPLPEPACAADVCAVKSASALPQRNVAVDAYCSISLEFVRS